MSYTLLKIKNLTVLVSFFCFSSMPVFAQPVFVIGVGNNSCGMWLDSKTNQNARFAYRSWVLGFLTGSNWHTTNSQAKISDPETAGVFIDQYCANNPLHSITLAAAALVHEAGGPKAAHEWKR